MGRILGLDIGARSVKALVIESNIRSFVVRAFAQQKYDEPAQLATALTTLQANHHLAADQVVVAVPGASVATHALSLPFADAKRVESTVGFEVEGQLPYDLSEAVFDYQILGVRDGKSDVLVAAVKKKDIEALLALLQTVKIDPRVVTTSALAYQSLLFAGLCGPSAVQPASDGAEAIIDIGHARTSICVGLSGKCLEYVRTFAGAGSDLTRTIAAEFKVSPLDAEAWKDSEADVNLEPNAASPSQRAQAALLRGLNPIVREIRATLRAHAARYHRSVTRVWLTGGTSRLKGLDSFFERELNVEVRRLEPSASGDNSPITAGSQMIAGQAFALAIRGHGMARASKINLRKGEFAFRADFDYLKGKASRLGALCGILLLLVFALVGTKIHVLSQAEAQIDRTLCNTTQRILGQCQKDFLVALSLLKGKGSPAANLPTYSALDLFNELINRSQSLNVKLSEIEIQLDRIRLHGETDSFDAVDKLVAALQGFKGFQEVKRGKVPANKDGKVQFDLDIRVKIGPEAEKI